MEREMRLALNPPLPCRTHEDRPILLGGTAALAPLVTAVICLLNLQQRRDSTEKGLIGPESDSARSGPSTCSNRERLVRKGLIGPESDSARLYSERLY